MIDQGASALESAYAGTTLALISEQLEGAAGQMRDSMTVAFEAGWKEASETLQKMLGENQKTFGTSLTKYLDPNSKTGIQAQMAEVFDQAGKTLFDRVARSFEDGDDSVLGKHFQKFSREIQAGFATLAAQLAVQHHKETATPQAGTVYEELALAAITEIAQASGDIVEHCAATPGQTKRKNGDILVSVNPDSIRGGGVPARMVFELKRRAVGAQRFSSTAIRTELNAAKANRAAQSAVLLVEDTALLPSGISFNELGGGDFAVVHSQDEPAVGLAVAYRLARLAAIRAVVEGAEAEIDQEAALRVIGEIRERMGRIEQLRAQHASAINAINRAGGVAEELAEGVLAGLRRLDAIVGV
ncbi:MAG TPA: hypothetical protein VNF75_06850 [Candidatus Dormibacteraeota bacterium]|nr:hypothetical protein [Candidatus Dormibacteraeota bacterium]